MTEAKFALTNTDNSLAEISGEWGMKMWTTSPSFFLRHGGCSPSDYRRQFKNNVSEQEHRSGFYPQEKVLF